MSDKSKALATFRAGPSAPASLGGLSGESKNTRVIRERSQESWNLLIAKGALALHADDVITGVHLDAERRLRSFIRHTADEQNEAWSPENEYEHTAKLRQDTFAMENAMVDYVTNGMATGIGQVTQTLVADVVGVLRRDLLPHVEEEKKEEPRRKGFLR